MTPLTPNLSLQEHGGHTALNEAPGECKGTPTPEQTRRLAQAMMAFTRDLFSLVARSSTRPNLVLSPLSVALALSHLALGTVAAPVQTSRAGSQGNSLPQSVLGGTSSIRVTWIFGKNADPGF